MGALLKLRLIQMYRGVGVGILVIGVSLITGLLIAGLYEGVEDSSKLKVGIVFQQEDAFTKEIEKSLQQSEVLKPLTMTIDEGLQAVKESRIEGLFVFDANLKERIYSNDLEGMVEVYYLDENYLPYLLTDLVGAELMGEIALSSVIGYYDGAMEAEGMPPTEKSGDFNRLYQLGKADMNNEKDNFFVTQTYIGQAGVKEDISLNNQLVFRQIILGVAYIFVAFFMMFLGVSGVRDRENGLEQRVIVTGISRWYLVLGDYVSLLIGVLPVILVVSLLQGYYDGHYGYFLVVNVCFVGAFAGVINLISRMFNKVTAYVLMATAMVLVMGIVSGSFFALDESSHLVGIITLMTPAYQLLHELTDMMVQERTLPSQGYLIYMLSVAGSLLVLTRIIDPLEHP